MVNINYAPLTNRLNTLLMYFDANDLSVVMWAAAKLDMRDIHGALGHPVAMFSGDAEFIDGLVQRIVARSSVLTHTDDCARRSALVVLWRHECGTPTDRGGSPRGRVATEHPLGPRQIASAQREWPIGTESSDVGFIHVPSRVGSLCTGDIQRNHAGSHRLGPVRTTAGGGGRPAAVRLGCLISLPLVVRVSAMAPCMKPSELAITLQTFADALPRADWFLCAVVALLDQASDRTDRVLSVWSAVRCLIDRLSPAELATMVRSSGIMNRTVAQKATVRRRCPTPAFPVLGRSVAFRTACGTERPAPNARRRSRASSQPSARRTSWTRCTGSH